MKAVDIKAPLLYFLPDKLSGKPYMRTTPLIRISGVTAGSLLFGMLLSQNAINWPIRPGFLGFGLMLLGALAVRLYWLKLKLAAPGSPERSLWIGLSTNAIIGGHLLGMLWQIGPKMQLHSLQTHALAGDNWTLVLGAALAWWIARDPDPRQDERDGWISNQGTHWAYYALVIVLIALSLMLGFGIGASTKQMSQPLIAHLLIGALMFSFAVANARQLCIYARDQQRQSVEESDL